MWPVSELRNFVFVLQWCEIATRMVCHPLVAWNGWSYPRVHQHLHRHARVWADLLNQPAHFKHPILSAACFDGSGVFGYRPVAISSRARHSVFEAGCTDVCGSESPGTWRTQPSREYSDHPIRVAFQMQIGSHLPKSVKLRTEKPHPRATRAG